MAISKKHSNVIDLADYRKPVPYPVDTTPEFPQPGQPGYMGTHTPQAPYGKEAQGEQVFLKKTTSLLTFFNIFIIFYNKDNERR